MNKVYTLLICIIAVIVLSYYESDSSEKASFAKPRGAVNDFAAIIPENEKQTMENLCREVLQKTGTAIVIATVESVGDSDLETYANELYATWGIGKKGEDKGVLLFLTQKERKVRIETGYGVEGILPDGLTGQILDDYVIPYLKQGDYGKGMLNGTIAIAQIIAQDAGVQLTGEIPYLPRPTPQGIGLGSQLIALLFFLIMFMIVIRNPFLIPLLFLGSGRSRGLGGTFGGFGGGFGGFGGGSSGGGGASRGF